MEIEVCAGCGIKAKLETGGHPMVGVMALPDAVAISEQYKDLPPNENNFVGVPVCAACHKDPGHRIVPLKCHFHFRQNAEAGIRFAGFPSIGGSVIR